MANSPVKDSIQNRKCSQRQSESKHFRLTAIPPYILVFKDIMTSPGRVENGTRVHRCDILSERRDPNGCRCQNERAVRHTAQSELKKRERQPDAEAREETEEPVPPVDDCEKMGTLFGELNKCLRGLGFSQLYFGEKIVEPVVVLVFWVLLGFLGVQALGLVGTLCIIIIYIQK
ncbi:hypothetical protein DNTS_001481 [Danionella cerebrum]|uniref:DUF4605 domain-containing protein n=1 Tax=Danionella cerebrum TaxID=2873325 RepID=A0A553N4Z7_9TELE|nr:hypothetical protein DNTS_001481 [Danionella translucida]